MALHIGLCMCKMVLEDREDIVAVYLSPVEMFHGTAAQCEIPLEGMADTGRHRFCRVSGNCDVFIRVRASGAVFDLMVFGEIASVSDDHFWALADVSFAGGRKNFGAG